VTRRGPGRVRRAALAPLLALVATARPALADDDWLGRDKALHFGVSAVLGGGGYAASTLFLEPRWQRATAGAAFSLTLGAAKELHDLAGRGDPSWRDFTWDVAGTAVGVGLGLVLDLLLTPDGEASPSSASPAAELSRSSASPLTTGRAPVASIRF